MLTAACYHAEIGATGFHVRVHGRTGAQKSIIERNMLLSPHMDIEGSEYTVLCSGNVVLYSIYKLLCQCCKWSCRDTINYSVLYKPIDNILFY